MGYEGHIVGLESRTERIAQLAPSMELLVQAHAAGGDLISAGGTGTYDLNTWATEIQAGSYALMDTAYGKLGLPCEQAISVLRLSDLGEQAGVGRRRLRDEVTRDGPG